LAHFLPDEKKENSQSNINNSSLSSLNVNNDSIKISAIELASEYGMNEMNADEKFKGKKLTVTGVVGVIRKDNFGQPFAGLDTQQTSVLVKVDFPSTENYLKRIAKMRVGDNRPFTGTCLGMNNDVVLISVENGE
jgi:hypothetical protein